MREVEKMLVFETSAIEVRRGSKHSLDEIHSYFCSLSESSHSCLRLQPGSEKIEPPVFPVVVMSHGRMAREAVET